MAQNDIFEYVSELENEIANGRKATFAKGCKIIEEDIIMEIIGDIKNSLHAELDASIRIMEERDQIIQAAEAQAAEILKKAKRDAETMVKKEEVVKAAQAKAAAIVETSRKNAQNIRTRANQYAEDVFDDLENYYKESMELIKVNKNRLYKKTDPSISVKEQEQED